MTKIINLFGGPGSGKSTTAYTLAGMMKAAHMNIELVTEYAKDLVWTERHKCIKCQPLIFGKQLHRVERLIGKVDYIITDSPILLSIIYNSSYPPSFNQMVLDIFGSMNNFNFFLRRGERPYNEIGRCQNREQAVEIDNEIFKFLLDTKTQFATINSEGAAEKIFQAAVDNSKLRGMIGE
jgi:energy-coupling factor transporter ATP-binding protein EcfA2